LSISEERFIANSHISAAHSEEDRQRQQWQKCIEQLTSWKHDPGQLDEEGTVTPSQATIRLALDLADSMCKRGLIPPTRIVPDADGGIVFERQKKDAFESIRISAGSIEQRFFEGCRLVSSASFGPPLQLDTPGLMWPICGQ
jgi:hypothetical protein